MTDGRVSGADTRDRAAWMAFDGFYADEYEPTLRVTYALCGSWPLAEEVTQEAFIRAYRRWHELTGMEVPGAWVRRVACNLAASRFRRLAAETRATARLVLRRVPQAAMGTTGDGDERFWELVRGLPARQAQAVALYYADDLAVREVAQVMGVAEGTVKAHLHAARQSLAEQLEDAEDEGTR